MHANSLSALGAHHAAPVGTYRGLLDSLVPGADFPAMKVSPRCSTPSAMRRSSRQAAEGFRREAEMLASLRHEHIPHVYDSFSEGNRHCLVMEYIDGMTLGQCLAAAGGNLDDSAVIHIAVQICGLANEAVAYQLDMRVASARPIQQGVISCPAAGSARHDGHVGDNTLITVRPRVKREIRARGRASAINRS
jgi:hypothetical protein